MAKTTTSNISIRMDSDLKVAAEALYEELGMNLSTAFNIFVRQSLRERGIPFKITEGTPNKETVSACLRQKELQRIHLLKAIIMLMIFLQTLKNNQIRNQKHYAV